ncbi:hypothetical protein B0T17DRAFT_615356 [Bombardia bombarda]|uniref:Enoyl reductase (ER) domain-containing protein n=1 Tax=Bombardia bombarda TaxID=252184 RepID=A0AA40C935_9PEZI|nr:hypothetical protein B0T17DRAFT_615356 [Bombardia bombarda]
MALSVPKAMSGTIAERPGGFETLKWRTDLAVPELDYGEILIKNEYIGVNYIDIYFRSGIYSTGSPFPILLGREGAGVVAAVHPSVRGFAVGDRGISTEQAAASLLQGLTAWTFIREVARITREVPAGQGPWVLVHAAAGGTGLLLVQLLAALGAKVIGTASTPAKTKLASDNGAQWVINSSTEDVVAKVKEITEGHGADVIFDGVGAATLKADFELIANNGSLISFGNASGPPDLQNLPRTTKRVKISRPTLMTYIGTKAARVKYVQEMFDFIKDGKLKIAIHDVYPLKEAGRAHADLESRKTTGKLLLKVD